MRSKSTITVWIAGVAVIATVLTVLVVLTKYLGIDLTLALVTVILTIGFVRWATRPTEWFPDGFAHDLAEDGTDVIGLVLLTLGLFVGGAFAITGELVVFGLVLCLAGACALGQLLATLQMPISESR